VKLAETQLSMTNAKGGTSKKFENLCSRLKTRHLAIAYELSL